MLERRGAVGIFVSKLIPMVRTVISIPAGVIRMNFIKYSVSSALGIFVWNFFLIGPVTGSVDRPSVCFLKRRNK